MKNEFGENKHDALKTDVLNIFKKDDYKYVT